MDRLWLLLLDAYALLCRVALLVSSAAGFAGTVWVDPLGLSNSAFPLGGGGAYRSARVISARSERERRALALLYRTNRLPAAADLDATLRLCGVAGNPAFCVRLYPLGGGAGVAVTATLILARDRQTFTAALRGRAESDLAFPFGSVDLTEMLKSVA